MPTSNCVIIDPYTGDHFQFQNAPAVVRDRKSANIKTVMIPGESNPRIVSPAGGDRTISFEVTMYAEDPDDRNTDWVKRQESWLKSLCYARVVNEQLGTRRVTPVFLILADLIETPVHIRAVDTSWGPFRDRELGPVVARIRIDCIELHEPGEFVDAVAARRGQALKRTWQVIGEDGSILGLFFNDDTQDA